MKALSGGCVRGNHCAGNRTRSVRRAVGRPLTAFSVALAFALVASAAERPRIGLALSGGGAKGGAHVGVLRVLEELEVPVDYIAGTSMGAIIGGLYASGIPADELERLLLEIDWEDAMSDEPIRADLQFRRKEDQARYLLDFELGIGRDGLEWPAGLLQGQKLYFLLQSLTQPVAGIDDFDELPVPFRCVATDIQTGEMVVLDSGNLAAALRASMAIPAVFAPVEYRGRLLVDGGVSRNLPVDVVREMGADVVIAVDLGAPLDERQVESLVEIYGQLTRMQIRSNVAPQLELADLVISPGTAVYGTLAFDRLPAIIELGYEAAHARQDELAEYADPEWYRGPVVVQRADLPTPVVDAIRVEGNGRVDERIVRERIRLEPGMRLDLEAVGNDLGRIYGLGDFAAVTYEIDPGPKGSEVVYHLREKPWGPNYLHFGLSLQTDVDGDTNFELLTNLTATRLNALGAEWRTDLRLGTDARLYSEFYQPLDFGGRWFVAPRVDLRSERPGFYQDGDRLAELHVVVGLTGLDAGRQFGKFGEVRVGLVRGRADVSVDSGSLPDELVEEFRTDDIDFGGYTLRATLDRIDRVTFPTRGSLSQIRAFLSRDTIGADVEYDKWEARLSGFHSFGRDTLGLILDGGWSPGSELPVYDEFLLGGFLSLGGFAENELRGQEFAVARAIYYRQVKPGRYLGGMFEAGNVWQTDERAAVDDLIQSGTVFFGVDSRLGPVYLAYSQAEMGNSSLYLVFGRLF